MYKMSHKGSDLVEIRVGLAPGRRGRYYSSS